MKSELTVSLEIRPRSEYTFNYTLAPNTTASPFINLTQRNRLSAKYERKSWLLNSEFQEIHILDRFHKNSAVGNINFYQLYLETKFKGLNIRAGRQSVLLDNGRIFSDAPWSQQSRAHEGLRVMMRRKTTSQDLFALYTRNYRNYFDKTYSPVGAHSYKYMFIYHLNYNSGKRFSFNSINAIDIFRDPTLSSSIDRITVGGRIEVKEKKWYLTLNSYLQTGSNPAGQKLFAWYIQPEIRLTEKKATVRLGAEFLSGTNPKLKNDQSGNFDVLYGVAWKFMGNMNVFTRFPADVAGKGLINPYLFVLLPLSKKLNFRSDFHLFYTQFPLLNSIGQEQKKYLGLENDLSLKFYPMNGLEINYAFAFLKSAPPMQYLPKIIDDNKIAVWSYLMISYSLSVLHLSTHHDTAR